MLRYAVCRTVVSLRGDVAYVLTVSCGLFWKAFGIVCALLLGWQVVKLIFWATKVCECL